MSVRYEQVDALTADGLFTRLHAPTVGYHQSFYVEDSILDEETGVILFTQPPLRQIYRTPSATRLLDTWFRGSHRGTGGIPAFFLEELAKAQAAWERGEAGP